MDEGRFGRLGGGGGGEYRHYGVHETFIALYK
jgi:hypothetical protein